MSRLSMIDVRALPRLRLRKGEQLHLFGGPREAPVKAHARVTASGKVAQVTQHQRKVEGGKGNTGAPPKPPDPPKPHDPPKDKWEYKSKFSGETFNVRRIEDPNGEAPGDKKYYWPKVYYSFADSRGYGPGLGRQDVHMEMETPEKVEAAIEEYAKDSKARGDMSPLSRPDYEVLAKIVGADTFSDQENANSYGIKFGEFGGPEYPRSKYREIELARRRQKGIKSEAAPPPPVQPISATLERWGAHGIRYDESCESCHKTSTVDNNTGLCRRCGVGLNKSVPNQGHKALRLRPHGTVAFVFRRRMPARVEMAKAVAAVLEADVRGDAAHEHWQVGQYLVEYLKAASGVGILTITGPGMYLPLHLVVPQESTRRQLAAETMRDLQAGKVPARGVYRARNLPPVRYPGRHAC